MAKKSTYADRTERTKFIIDQFALYRSPKQIWEALQELFNDEDSPEDFKRPVPSINAVRNYESNYIEDVLARRRYFQRELPILDPTWRFMRYQEIVVDALAGDEVSTKFGSYIKKDRTAAINALKQVDKITGFGEGDKDAKDELRQIIEETRRSLKAEGKWSEDEINAQLDNLFPEAKEIAGVM